MNAELFAEGFSKGLEAWSLQNMVDTGVILSFIALGLMACRAYLNSYRERMSLRISSEIWDLALDMGTDLSLFGAALIGLLTCNPDIMVDVKIALPWLPLANLLMGAALVLRAFHGGRKTASRGWWAALALAAVACLLNWFGFTFVMEGATDEYFPSNYPPFWSMLRHMRSDMNRELALSTFHWAGLAFFALFAWAVVTGLFQTISAAKRQEKDDGRIQR